MTVLCLTMCSEIETKLKVDSHQPIEAALEQLGAEFIEVQLQSDEYFDDVNRTFTNEDKCLRLRSQKADHKHRLFLTYKGPKEKHQIKIRPEIEIEITNAGDAQKLLLALGYKLMMTVQKKRTLWKFNQCDIALDELPLLGTFVEIEGPDAKTIEDVKTMLNLAHLSHINDSYACLMEKHSSQKT